MAPRIACVMMQKDEAFLLRPWLAYHGHLFGFENLFVLDNGSTLPAVRDTLMEFARKGVTVDWTRASRQDYLAKGELVGDRIGALEASGAYDFLIPLDCDEFVLLHTEREFSCSRDDILAYFLGLAGETTVFRFPWQLANHPLVPDIYHRFEFFKVFFASGAFSPMDHGHHLADHRPGMEPKDTRLIHLHFHYKMLDIKIEEARRSWVGTVDVNDPRELAGYTGPSAHLNHFFLRDKAHYYRGFLDIPHFYLPRFRALLNDLGAPLDLPAEPVPPELSMRVSEIEDAAKIEANGTIVLVPTNRGAGGTGPVEFRAMRFHEADYLAANPALAAAGVDPTIHFCLHGFRENRPLRPAAPSDGSPIRQAIAAYLAGDGPIRPGPDGKRCLELGAGEGPRHSGWLATDLEPIGTALKLDVTRVFPIDDRSFDYVYSQHMIEHLTFEGGRFMLRECFRVLKPGGTIRIATPSIDFLFSLFAADRPEPIDRYIQWATRRFVPGAPRPMASLVFNNFVRAWGHQFIYDRATLELILHQAGFANVQEREIGKSDHFSLRGLEAIHRMPEGFLALESMILEAVRPVTPS